VNNQTGAQFEILADGKPRSYRDTNIAATEAATFLKSQQQALAQLERQVMRFKAPLSR
jgi:hypothetical protein